MARAISVTRRRVMRSELVVIVLNVLEPKLRLLLINFETNEHTKVIQNSENNALLGTI